MVFPLRDTDREGPEDDNAAAAGSASFVTAHFCGATPLGGLHCTCRYYEINAKRCSHLWAMVQYELNGSVLSFENNAAIVEAELAKYDKDFANRIAEGYIERPDTLGLHSHADGSELELPCLEDVDVGGPDSLNRPVVPGATGTRSEQHLTDPFASRPVRQANRPLPLPAQVSPHLDQSPVANKGSFEDVPRTLSSTDRWDGTAGPSSNGGAHAHSGRLTASLPFVIGDPAPESSQLEEVMNAMRSVVSQRRFDAKYAVKRKSSPGETGIIIDEPHPRPRRVDFERNVYVGLLGRDGSEAFSDVPLNPDARPPSPRGETGPIGRRHAPSRSRADPDASMSAAAFTGRPSVVKPLHPARSGKKRMQRQSRSTIALQATVQNRLHAPSGIPNSGPDCYLSALFQVLCRCGKWTAQMERACDKHGGQVVPLMILCRAWQQAVPIGGASRAPAIRSELASEPLMCSLTVMLTARTAPHRPSQRDARSQ